MEPLPESCHPGAETPLPPQQVGEEEKARAGEEA